MRCPQCGAPPPPDFTVPVGQFTYKCVYCKQQSVLGTPAVVHPPPQQGPTFIVLHTHGDDDDDDDHQHHHPPPAFVHANAARGASWIVWLVIVLVFSLGGSGAAFMRCSKHSALISSLVWDGTEPLQCAGTDAISVTGVEANFTGGSAIQATGNCNVRCTDCNITAPTAIEASGNAQVTIIGGTIRGTTLLADATGNAHVNISGNVTASGRVKESGNAKVSAPPPPAPSASPVASAAATAKSPPPAPTTAKPASAAKPAKASPSAKPRAAAGN